MSSIQFNNNHPQYNQIVDKMRGYAQKQTIGKVLTLVGSVTIGLILISGFASLKAHLFLASCGGGFVVEGVGMLVYSTFSREILKNQNGITSETSDMQYDISDFTNDCVDNTKRFLEKLKTHVTE